MKRAAPTIWAAVVVLAVAGLAYRDSQQKEARERAMARAAAETQNAETESAEPEPSEESEKAQLEVPLPSPSRPAAARFHTMPDGSPVPALPSSAPDRVKLGVALFRYQGAQGASDSTRSRESALQLAQDAAKLASSDFEAAVEKGDRGSHENVGWIQQRILERSVEYAVFTLEKGQTTSKPIDTPRGFWVVKRLR